MKFFFANIVLLLICFSAYSQTIELTGKITDKETGESLPHANIYLLSNYNYGTVSNKEGIFKFTIPRTDSVDHLNISYVGYTEQRIRIIRSKDINLSIELEPITTELNDVVVKGRRIIAEEFTITQINKMDVYLNPAAKADPLLAVSSMPASTTTDESANISLRGSNPSETGIFLNDVPVYDAVRFSQINGIGTFSIFNTAIVNRLQVFPGNPPLEYGNTTAGLISIQTDENIPEKSVNSFSASMANIGIFSTGKLGDKSAYTFFANYQPSDILKFFNKKALEDLDNFHTYDIGLHLISQFNKNTSLKIFNYTNFEGYKFKLRTPSWEGVFKQDKKRNLTVMNFLKNFENSELTINNGLNFSTTKYIMGNMNVQPDNSDWYYSINYQHFIDRLSIKTGFTYDSRKTNLKAIYPLNAYAMDINHPTFLYDTITKLIVPEYYVYTKYKFNDQFVVGAGLRKNVRLKDHKDYLSAQFNFLYKLNQKNSINLSAGQYHKYYFPKEEYSRVTLIQSRQITLDYKFKSGVNELSAALFIKKSNFGNINNLIYGTEVFGKMKITEKFLGQISYSFINSENKKEGLNYPSKFDLNYFFRGSIKYQFNNTLDMSVIFIHRQGTYYVPIIGSEYNTEWNVFEPLYASVENSERLPDYSKFDFSISKMFPVSENLSIIAFLGINNIFNTNNVRDINYTSNYSGSFQEHFSKRTIYFGGLINF